MYDFEYHKPSSVADAVKLLSADPDARPISGGQTLLPALKHRLNRPTYLVDLSGIAELKGIKREGDKITVGAMTKHFEVENSAEIKSAIPALAWMAGHLGDVQVRNRGTMGGSVANNDPAADYPAAVLALDATVVTDKRRIAADDFFQGMFTTALEPGELLTAIEFPIPEKAGYAKMRNPASRYVMAGVFVAKTGRRRARRGERRRPAACSARRRWSRPCPPTGRPTPWRGSSRPPRASTATSTAAPNTGRTWSR